VFIIGNVCGEENKQLTIDNFSDLPPSKGDMWSGWMSNEPLLHNTSVCFQ